MAKKKNFKATLVMAIMSLVACLSMFAGTTFAWFTDSVTSSGNIIKAGTLDVELYYQAEGQTGWTEVNKDTNVFTNTLWEPGHTEVIKLKVVNAGSLALKYKLGIHVASEVVSINKYNEELKLSNYIKYGIIDGDKTYTREQAIAAVDATASFLNSEYNSGNIALEAKNETDSDEKIVTMVVYMPNTIGGEANAKKGEVVPTINLGIDLFATQLASESDSFDNTYDDNAMYPGEIGSADDLLVALTKGGSYKLVKDVTTEQITIPAGTSAVINLNGKSLTGAEYTTSSGSPSLNNVVNNSGELTITGEGTIRTRNIINNAGAKLVIDGNINIIGGAVGGGSAIWNEGDCVINGATITQANDWNYAIQNVADNATMEINNANVSANHGAVSNTGANTSLVINGGTFNCLADGHVVYTTNGSITINGGTFIHSYNNATAQGNSVVYAKSNVEIKGGTFDSVNAAFSYKDQNTNISISGGVCMNSAKTVYKGGSLNDFVVSGYQTVENEDGSVTIGIVTSGQPWHELDAVHSDTVVDGGGNTYAEEYQEVCLAGNADITIKGVTFQNGLTLYENNTTAKGTITLENCVIYLNNGNGNAGNSSLNMHYADYGLYIGAISPYVSYVFKNCKFTAYDSHTYTNVDKGYNVYIGGNYSADSITFSSCTFEKSSKHGIGCSFGYTPNAENNVATYYNLNVTGCTFDDWNKGNYNGAAIRGNVPSTILEKYEKSITIEGNTFGNSNGSTKDNVAIDEWTGTWN